VQVILQHTQTMKNKVICYVMCTKQTEKLGVMVKDPCIISLKSINMILLDSIPLCDIIKAYTDIYVNTQQLLFNITLFCAWRHVSAAHTAIFRPAYNRTGPFMCAQYGIPDCLHIKYM